MPRRQTSRISCIILAAGASTRMGLPKQLLRLRGKPILQYVIEQAAGSCVREIVLVLGHRASEVRASIQPPATMNFLIVVNEHYADGQSSSLRLGLQSVAGEADAAAILLGDQPYVPASTINTVVSAFIATNLPAARPIYRDIFGDAVPGHPVIIDRRLWPLMENVTGDQGAQAIFSAHPEWLYAVQFERTPHNDIDSWNDYMRALQIENP